MRPNAAKIAVANASINFSAACRRGRTDQVRHIVAAEPVDAKIVRDAVGNQIAPSNKGNKGVRFIFLMRNK